MRSEKIETAHNQLITFLLIFILIFFVGSHASSAATNAAEESASEKTEINHTPTASPVGMQNFVAHPNDSAVSDPGISAGHIPSKTINSDKEIPEKINSGIISFDTIQAPVNSDKKIPAAAIPAAVTLENGNDNLTVEPEAPDSKKKPADAGQDASHNNELPVSTGAAAVIPEALTENPQNIIPESDLNNQTDSALNEKQDQDEPIIIVPAAAISAGAAAKKADDDAKTEQKNTDAETEKSGAEQDTGLNNEKTGSAFPAAAIPSAIAAENSLTEVQEPVKNDNGSIDGNILGKNNRHVHGFFSISQLYKSNLYKTDSAPEDAWATFYTPGIWVSVPSTRKRVIEMFSANSSPGGLAISTFNPSEKRTFQSYVLYSPQFEIYHDKDIDNLETHRVDGYIHYRWNKLALRAMDQFKKSHDWLTSRFEAIDDTYKSNLFNTAATYDPTRKLQLRLDYSNFNLNYDDTRNKMSDRVDDSIAAYVFFRLTAKSSVFVEFDFSDIDYDSSDKDSREYRYFGGYRWEITEKSSGQIKGGFGEKKFANSDSSASDWMAEIQIDHNLDSRTNLTLNAYRHYDEVLDHRYSVDNFDEYYAKYVEAYFLGLSLTRDLTSKIHLSLDSSVFYDRFKEDRNDQKERHDTDFTLSPSLNFDVFKWMTINAAYIYTDHISNYPNNDYIDHTVFLRASVFF